MEDKKEIIIPSVPKEDREQIEMGYHSIPNWLLYTLGIVISIGLYVGILYK